MLVNVSGHESWQIITEGSFGDVRRKIVFDLMRSHPKYRSFRVSTTSSPLDLFRVSHCRLIAKDFRTFSFSSVQISEKKQDREEFKWHVSDFAMKA